MKRINFSIGDAAHQELRIVSSFLDKRQSDVLRDLIHDKYLEVLKNAQTIEEAGNGQVRTGNY